MKKEDKISALETSLKKIEEVFAIAKNDLIEHPMLIKQLKFLRFELNSILKLTKEN